MLWKKIEKDFKTSVQNIIKEQPGIVTMASNTPLKPKQSETIEKSNEISILDALIKVAPIFQKLVPMDCMIGVTDKEKFLYGLYGKEMVLLGGKDIAGMPIPEEDAIYKAIHTGNVTYVEMHKEALGIPFKSIGVPVRGEKGNVIGGIGMGISVANQEKLLNISQMFVAASHQIASTAGELFSTATQLAKHEEMLKDFAEQVLVQVNRTDAILSFISEVAATSNLLGLNASIEAARAGEHGSGFSVVAEEIRKMSSKSTNYVKEIKQILVAIKERTIEMSEKITNTSIIAKEQAAATKEITAAIENLANSSVEIEEIAKII